MTFSFCFSSAAPGFWGPPREASKLDKVRANWDEIDLYKVRNETTATASPSSVGPRGGFGSPRPVAPDQL